MCSFSVGGPALLVVPLFVVSLVNLLIAGPPLKTIVLESSGAAYGASLPFMQLHVGGDVAKFTLMPNEEMTHFFVVAANMDMTRPTPTPPVFDAVVRGIRNVAVGDEDTWHTLMHTSKLKPSSSLSLAAPPSASRQSHRSRIQLLQPLIGYSKYEVLLKMRPSALGATPPVLPPVEYRVTYVPLRFSLTQACVRGFFLVSSTTTLLALTCAIAGQSHREPGQLWIMALLVLLVALNDPLYIARLYLAGHQGLHIASVFGQILFSGTLFLFWLVYADGMNSYRSARPFCSFYLPKLILVGTYVGVASAVFVVHGRLPDRLNISDSANVNASGRVQLILLIALCASVVCVAAWLCLLISQAMFRLGWKKVEYIYTEREKSFVGITVRTVTHLIPGLSGVETHLYTATCR